MDPGAPSEAELTAAILDELSDRSETGARLHCVGTIATGVGTVGIVASLDAGVGDWQQLLPWLAMVGVVVLLMVDLLVRNREISLDRRRIDRTLVTCALSGLVVGSVGWFDRAGMEHQEYAYAMCAVTLAFCAGTLVNLNPLSMLIAATIIPAVGSLSLSLVATGNWVPAACAVVVLGIVLRPLPSMRRNVEELVRARLLADHASTHDGLTGVRNRSGLSLAHMNVSGILYGDIDDFKAVNDRHGHAIGDQVLRDLASRLRRIADEHGACVARFGGDEFVVAVDGSEQLRSLAEQVRTAAARPFPIVGNVGFSFGCAEQTETEAHGPEALASLIAEADRALYRSKRSKREPD